MNKNYLIIIALLLLTGIVSFFGTYFAVKAGIHPIIPLVICGVFGWIMGGVIGKLSLYNKYNND